MLGELTTQLPGMLMKAFGDFGMNDIEMNPLVLAEILA